MGNKKETELDEPIGVTTSDPPLDIQPEVVEVAPILKEETTPLLSGYIQIKPIGKEAEGVIVKAKQFGTIYPKDKWEIVATKKK